MSGSDAWSPDEPSGTEAFEQGDEALDDDATLGASGVEIVEQDPSLDPTLLVDEVELSEAGALLDDPESLAVLDGGIDDPDGTGPRRRAQRGDEDAGWDLDAPLASADDSEDDDG
jgi:hypothetical protein